VKIAGVIIVLIGLLLLGLGAYLFVQEQLFLQRAELTTAAVTENRLYTYTGQVNEYGVQHYYCSEFKFQTKEGRIVSFEEGDDCANLDSPPDYQIGQKVDVYYDPRDPSNTVQMRKDAYSNTVAAVVAGALFTLLGLGLFWFSLWRNRPGAASRAS
jgi:hypothetical protein